MIERHNLGTKLDSKLFREFYYLKEELVKFCRENGLSISGGKLELTERIVYFLETGKALNSLIVKVERESIEIINEETKIEPNFVCSKKYRAFFKEHIGKNFSFNVTFQE